MPGSTDPSSHLMPQQPFHPCMFPKSCMFSTFNCVTNPHHAIYDEHVEILATSGQNVDIISRFSDIKDPIEVMKSHLTWGSCAPNAPDNLYSSPYEDDDPFVINFIPEIYITGCQSAYRTDYYYYYSTLQASKCDGSSQSSAEPLGSTSSDVNVTPELTRESGIFSISSRTVSDLAFDSPPEPRRQRLDDGAAGIHSTPKLAGRRVGSQRSGDDVSASVEEDTQRNLRKSRTLLVTVPKFSETYSCVLISLTSLESHLLSFSQ